MSQKALSAAAALLAAPDARAQHAQLPLPASLQLVRALPLVCTSVGRSLVIPGLTPAPQHARQALVDADTSRALQRYFSVRRREPARGPKWVLLTRHASAAPQPLAAPPRRAPLHAEPTPAPPTPSVRAPVRQPALSCQ